MSCAAKKKHLKKEILGSYEIPTNEQKIVQVVRACGNYLYEVISSEEETFLASEFIVVNPIPEGGKVKGEISEVLFKNHIQYLKNQGVWPKKFSDKYSEELESHSEDSDDDLFVNTNRINVNNEAYSSTSEESDDDDEEEEEKRRGKRLRQLHTPGYSHAGMNATVNSFLVMCHFQKFGGSIRMALGLRRTSSHWILQCVGVPDQARNIVLLARGSNAETY
ncbi:probable RNA-binding protein EIF1AD [Caerostris extrusa]|uniref:Probable RNA-binding protein EIF1AD n=1 Tax=Caerostris extrusa TaxID=172846 RepID=A0AAV4SDS4_CAEEX|nr:probable RNA-binding protein EIF1AD [Caerostris extrusa]